MPTIGNIIRTAAPAAINLGTGLLANRGLGNATNAVTAGANTAGVGLDAALAQRQKLYNTSVANQQPYQATGLKANTAYQDLLDNPTNFDPATVMNEPGYQFGQDQTQKAVERLGHGVFNGAQVKGKIKAVLDYNTQKYNDAFNRFMATQKNRQDVINGGVNIGQQANQAVDAAGTTLGNAITGNAEDKASLELAKANAQATSDVLGANNNANTLGKVLGTAQDVAGLFKKAAPAVAGTIGSYAPGLVGGEAAPALQGATALIPGLGIESAGIAAPTLGAATAAGTAGTTGATGAAASTASGGGLGSTLAGLATNPITIGVAGALAAGAIWLKSQAHWEANTAVKDFENPFHEQSLAPFAAQWDQAIKSGNMTAQQGHDSLDQYIQNFQDYTDKIQQWAGSKSKDKKKVAEQSIANLYKTTVGPQIQKMQSQIQSLPGAA